MIRIEKIIIEKFRGIIALELDIKSENFAACGPNGTGKSGIVDAIEFALTGNISRLSGQGTGGLSVKQHGPHVDYRDKPEEASVTLEVFIPSLGGKKATITRAVKTVAPVITPKDADVLEAFADVARHPEFVLSRRELIRYVVSEPGQRSKEVQALLRLDEVEKLRTVLQKIANKYTKEMPPLERSETDAAKHLLSVLQIGQLTKTAFLEAVNPKRTVLGLPPLTDLSSTTIVTDGMETASSSASVQSVSKAQALNDVGAAKDALDALTGETFAKQIAALLSKVTALADDPACADGVTRQQLLNDALAMYDGFMCPVCDTPFGPEEFIGHLKDKLAHLDEVAVKRKEIETLAKPVIDGIFTAGKALAAIISYGAKLEPAVDVSALSEHKQILAGRYSQLEKLMPLADTITILNTGFGDPLASAALDKLAASITALPEPSTQDAAKSFLTIAQERLTQYRIAGQSARAGKARAERAAKIYELFGSTTTKALEGIYSKVQDTFSELYREINKEDESGFTAKLMPSLGKLGFDVDFYGRGHFPPGAYHSEGHQDGMGLCLYLALMRHLLGDRFTFAVLDDVLMSVDRGHRREVCALLKSYFPHTQFIFTTHDDVWLRHMKSEGIIRGKNFIHFKTWNVEVGPAEWTNDGVWDEIDGHLAKGDVNIASAVLRRYLEYFAGEASHRLRARVEYKGDGQFVFGDLIVGAAMALGDAFKKAKAAAQSWGQAEAVAAIAAKEAEFSAARATANLEQWQVNASIHYNPWADLGMEDFKPVVAAYKKFTAAFSCPDCGAMLYATPEFGTKESVRCDCNCVNLNFNAKKGGKPVAAEPSDATS